MISLAVLPLLVSFAAPDLGPYQLEPWNDIRPSWMDPLIDSLKPGGSFTIFGERRLPDGTISGRDTLRTYSVPSGLHEVSVWWQFDRDTTHSTREIWTASRMSEIDSMTKEYFRGDSTSSWYKNGKTAFPGGEITWMSHGPKNSSKQEIDTTFKYFDAKGRTVATRTILHIFQSGGPGGFTETPGTLLGDSITWSDDGKPVRWSHYDSSRFLASSPFEVSREVHKLAWDGYHLVRDSTWSWKRTPNGDTTRDSSFYDLKWDGPRLLDGADWNERGLPVASYGSYMAMWAWDSLGRMTRLWEWGTESDFDSLIYGKGPWPEKRLIHSCADTFFFDGTRGKVDCELEETVFYTYAISGQSAIGARPSKSVGARVEHGALVLTGLDPTSCEAVLIDASGRSLSHTGVVDGRAALHLPGRSGIALWRVLDGSGRGIASGRVLLP